MRLVASAGRWNGNATLMARQPSNRSPGAWIDQPWRWVDGGESPNRAGAWMTDWRVALADPAGHAHRPTTAWLEAGRSACKLGAGQGGWATALAFAWPGWLLRACGCWPPPCLAGSSCASSLRNVRCAPARQAPSRASSSSSSNPHRHRRTNGQPRRRVHGDRPEAKSTRQHARPPGCRQTAPSPTAAANPPPRRC